MGKKSRAKKERRESGETGLEKTQSPKKSGSERFLLEIIRFGTYLILFTPLILSAKFYFPFVGPKSLYFMGGCEIVFFSWLFLAIEHKQYRPKLNAISLALTLFLIVLVLSSVLGVDFSRSFWSKYERMTGLLMWFHLFGFFLALSSSFQRKSDWKRIFIVSIFVSILVSLVALLEMADVETFKFSGRGGATLGNTSFLGTYLLFNIFLALHLFVSEFGKFRNKRGEIESECPPRSSPPTLEFRRDVSSFKKSPEGVASRPYKVKNWGLVIYSLLGVFLAVPAMYFSGARAAYISTFGGVGLLALLWLSFQPKRKNIRILGKILLLLSSLMVLTALILLFLPGNFIHQKFIEVTTRSRSVNWAMAQKAFVERPLLGWGPENYEIAFTKFFNPCLFTPECGGEIWFDRAHNIIFDTLVTTGILGFLAYLGLFGVLFYSLGKKYFKEKALDFWTFSIFITVPVVYFIQNITVFDMITSLMMFLLVLGFGAFSASSIGSQPPTNSIDVLSNTTVESEAASPAVPRPPRTSVELVGGKKGWLNSILFLVFCFSFFNFIVQPLRTDSLTIKALQAKDSSERVELYKKALDASPLGKHQLRDFFAQYSQETFIRNIQKILREDVVKELDFLIPELEKTKKESPLDFRATLKLANIYDFYSLFDPQKLSLAEKYGQESIGLSPTNQQGYWTLARTKTRQGDFETALSLVQKAIDLEPEWLQSYKIAVQIAELSGNTERVKEFVQKAIEINPVWKKEFKDILEESGESGEPGEEEEEKGEEEKEGLDK